MTLISSKTLLLSQISWLLVLFAKNVYYLYASRILLGFFGGGTYTVGMIKQSHYLIMYVRIHVPLLISVPLFLTEISQDQ